MNINRIFTLFAVAIAALMATAQNDAPLRLAVAGVTHGHLWEVSAKMNRGDFTVVGAYEPNAEYRAANALTGKLAPELFFDNLEKMLDTVKPEAVVAYGCIADHVKVVEACAPRHINVMVEKPLATTAADAKRMAELAKQYGILVLTNYETSWYSSNHYVKQMVDAGTLGDIMRINVYDGHGGPAEIGCDKKFLEWLTHPVLNGGGAVIDFGCYGANLATWILNKRPESVYAVLKTHKPQTYPNVDDDATIVLSYADGPTVQVMGSWCWPYSRKDMWVYGAKGYAYQKNNSQVETLLDGKVTPPFETPALKAPFDDSYRYLKAAVRGEIKVTAEDLASPENNVIVVEILEAAKKSARTGKAVKL